MKFLFISARLPMPDRASGDLRFFTLLEQFSAFGEVTLCPFLLEKQQQEIGKSESERYIETLSKAKIQIGHTNVLDTLRTTTFDFIFFEFYIGVKRYIDMVRFYQPDARVIVDSVDIHYKRELAKAGLTKAKQDLIKAHETKQDELEAYQASDAVICVTEEDQIELEKELAKTPKFIIPNIHHVPPYEKRNRPPRKLIFVGSFDHEPNIDAVVYFCEKIFPLLISQHAGLQLDVIGPNPPPEVLAFQNESIRVHGRVPELAPYYISADISIAPLRFGAGMKGKVGEAMSYGLPVVSTSFGAEGFGFENHKEIIVADDPAEFAQAVHLLIESPDKAAQIAEAGYQFIYERYSLEANQERLAVLKENLLKLKPQSLPFYKRLQFSIKIKFDQHIRWRLK